MQNVRVRTRKSAPAPGDKVILSCHLKAGTQIIYRVHTPEYTGKDREFHLITYHLFIMTSGNVKNWCFTINNYEDEDIVKVKAFGETQCDYLIFGYEVGEAGEPSIAIDN